MSENPDTAAMSEIPDTPPPTETRVEAAAPLEGAVEVDWSRPLDEWEVAFKDELFLWGPFFRGLGHAHINLDANAKYALARIAGILHRAALEAAGLVALSEENERLRGDLKMAQALFVDVGTDRANLYDALRYWWKHGDNAESHSRVRAALGVR